MQIDATGVINKLGEQPTIKESGGDAARRAAAWKPTNTLKPSFPFEQTHRWRLPEADPIERAKTYSLELPFRVTSTHRPSASTSPLHPSYQMPLLFLTTQPR
jgi:hypothetical protein